MRSNLTSTHTEGEMRKDGIRIPCFVGRSRMEMCSDSLSELLESQQGWGVERLQGMLILANAWRGRYIPRPSHFPLTTFF